MMGSRERRTQGHWEQLENKIIVKALEGKMIVFSFITGLKKTHFYIRSNMNLLFSPTEYYSKDGFHNETDTELTQPS